MDHLITLTCPYRLKYHVPITLNEMGQWSYMCLVSKGIEESNNLQSEVACPIFGKARVLVRAAGRQIEIQILDSSVGLVTRYGLDGPGIESRRGTNFPYLSRPAQPASFAMGTGSFPGVKRPGRGVNHPPLSSAEVKKRVHLYLYSPSGPSWPVLG